MSATKPLKDLSRHEHATLKASGLLWELYPAAAGIWTEDCEPITVKLKPDLRALPVPQKNRAWRRREAVVVAH